MFLILKVWLYYVRDLLIIPSPFIVRVDIVMELFVYGLVGGCNTEFIDTLQATFFSLIDLILYR